MRYITQIFQPLITVPKNAKIKNTEITCKSQKLLIELGLIRPAGSGLFTILPLAKRALAKLENIVSRCIENAGYQRISLSSITSEALWNKSGRLVEVGSELLKLRDRHDKKYLLAPTYEEAIADLLADVSPISYKQLPILLYQIGDKFRDELRPKHGLLRARQFLMMDAYGAHANDESALIEYDAMTNAFAAVFKAIEMPVYRVKAPPGEMGGSESHEWHTSAAAGEDRLAVCETCARAYLEARDCAGCGGKTEFINSIEVGHTFLLGDRYSKSLGASFIPSSGNPQPLIMSCYGIGLTRLLSAGLEALSSDTALRWPRGISPYTIAVIGPKEGSKEWIGDGKESESVSHLLRQLESKSWASDVVIDDRHNLTIGKRIMMADRVGYPFVVVCGKAAPAQYEVRQAKTGGECDLQMMDLRTLMESIEDHVTNHQDDAESRATFNNKI